MSTAYESIALARVADILFCSALTPEQHATDAQVFTAIRESLTQHGDWTTCMRVVRRAFAADVDAAAELVPRRRRGRLEQHGPSSEYGK
jgi:hypothetical protein